VSRWLSNCDSKNEIACAPQKLANKVCLLPQVGDSVKRHVNEHAVAILATGRKLERSVIYVVAEETPCITADLNMRMPLFMHTSGDFAKGQQGPRHGSKRKRITNALTLRLRARFVWATETTVIGGLFF
jgi:hypothetical protein